MPIRCPSSDIRFIISGYFSAFSPMIKKVAFIPRFFNPSRRIGVVLISGPSSKVIAIYLGITGLADFFFVIIDDAMSDFEMASK